MSDATTAIAHVLSGALGTQRLRLSRAWTSARSGDAAALRLARIASRRLREVLAIAERVGPGRQTSRARRDLRRITRALGPVREIEVALDRFGEASRRHGWALSRVAPIRRRLDKEKRVRRETLAEWMSGADVMALGRRLSAVAALLRRAEAAAVERALAERIMRRTREVRLAATRCGTLYAPERLHTVRIAIKKLRYALELGVVAGHVELDAAVKALARLQKHLGALHDVQVLHAEAQAVAKGRAVASRAAGELVGDALERDCRLLHASVVADLGWLESSLADVRRIVATSATSERRDVLAASVVPLSRRRVVG